MRWWPRDLLELMAPFHLMMWMIVVAFDSSLIMKNEDLDE
jgi:hypothetical protein